MNPGRLFSLPILRLNDLRQLWEEESIYEALDEREDEGSSAFLWMMVGAAMTISLHAALIQQGVQI
jgi:hypothetical protein